MVCRAEVHPTYPELNWSPNLIKLLVAGFQAGSNIIRNIILQCYLLTVIFPLLNKIFTKQCELTFSISIVRKDLEIASLLGL